jgi:hypothetical protein
MGAHHPGNARLGHCDPPGAGTDLFKFRLRSAVIEKRDRSGYHKEPAKIMSIFVNSLGAE